MYISNVIIIIIGEGREITLVCVRSNVQIVRFAILVTSNITVLMCCFNVGK